jgi:hypothetical protein
MAARRPGEFVPGPAAIRARGSFSPAVPSRRATGDGSGQSSVQMTPIAGALRPDSAGMGLRPPHHPWRWYPARSSREVSTGSPVWRDGMCGHPRHPGSRRGEAEPHAQSARRRAPRIHPAPAAVCGPGTTCSPNPAPPAAERPAHNRSGSGSSAQRSPRRCNRLAATPGNARPFRECRRCRSGRPARRAAPPRRAAPSYLARGPHAGRCSPVADTASGR